VSKRLRCRHLAGLAQVKNPDSPAMVRARVTDDLMLEGGRRHSHADRDRGASTTMASVRRTTKTTKTGLPRKPWRASTDASNLFAVPPHIFSQMLRFLLGRD
jgi:hypothetical protein